MSEVINYQFRLNGVLIFKIEFLIYYYVWYTNQYPRRYNVIKAVVDCGAPNTVKLDFQFLQTMQVGGAPTQ
ncbi:hypothetical protein F2X81_09560 [Staphylococcus aureus]|nr:hypothetical protein CU118_07280 [Staphylococcus aureus]MSN57011.1 hypothetical protein [Staphylococcus aureus]MSN63080.1 hypothetical protein [Staphylococcus aureus]MSN70906.1 hypothetical protein [Staphylococcus aureus]MSN79021.1 hypothetical protein [Staphylococcus aureus]